MKPHCGKVLILSQIRISNRLILVFHTFHRGNKILKLGLILFVFFVEQKLQFFNSVEAITGG